MNFAGHTAAFWNERYGEADFAYGTAPNAWLAAQADRLPASGRALVPGDGEGRNGVWLAEQGLDVLALDLSAVSLARARRLAAERGVDIETERADLTAWAWPEAAFDVVASVFLHLAPEVRPRLHGAMLGALRPGGLLVVEAFRPAQLVHRDVSGGPPQGALLYAADTLRADFAGAEVLHLEETETVLREGAYHDGRAAVVRGLFRRM